MVGAPRAAQSRHQRLGARRWRTRTRTHALHAQSSRPTTHNAQRATNKQQRKTHARRLDADNPAQKR
eukprot:1888222-Pleurochrysis_carterae.AAC.1